MSGAHFCLTTRSLLVISSGSFCLHEVSPLHLYVVTTWSDARWESLPKSCGTVWRPYKGCHQRIRSVLPPFLIYFQKLAFSAFPNYKKFCRRREGEFLNTQLNFTEVSLLKLARNPHFFRRLMRISPYRSCRLLFIFPSFFLPFFCLWIGGDSSVSSVSPQIHRYHPKFCG